MESRALCPATTRDRNPVAAPSAALLLLAHSNFFNSVSEVLLETPPRRNTLAASGDQGFQGYPGFSTPSVSASQAPSPPTADHRTSTNTTGPRATLQLTPDSQKGRSSLIRTPSEHPLPALIHHHPHTTSPSRSGGIILTKPSCL